VAGAVVGVLVYGLVVAPFLPVVRDVDHLALAVCLLVLTALSIIGDLFESLSKRQADMKDSSQLLPGHGGILDRIDSLTSTLPVVALGLYLIAS
jgi:phosphatidate cytidylyltransferase